MNIYQQNNASVRLTSIQIVNVVFNQVVVDSNINHLLSDLKVSYSELERLVKMKMPSSDVKRKAIEVNSRLEVLMGSTTEIDFNSRVEFCKNLIKSCSTVIKKYKEAGADEEFGDELMQELASGCIDFFEREFGNQLNQSFWFDLQYYEWLQKEGFIYNGYSLYAQRNDRYFSDDHLERFFSNNRDDILRKMLNEQREYNGNLNVSSPLSNPKKNTIFQAYKLLPSAT